MSIVHARIILLVLVGLLVLPPIPQPVAAETVPVGSTPATQSASLPLDLTALYFEATSRNLGGGFLRYWWEHGQLPIFGFPISEEFTENGRTVQYFERARFEYFPEYRGTPYEVQLGHLGRLVAGDRSEWAFQPIAPVSESVERAFFPATGHSISFGFKRFWENNDGLYNFGYPISEEFSENNLTVQYFERARFEYHPQHRGTPYEVQLGHLGRFVAQAREAPIVPAARRSDATTWTPNLMEEINQRIRQQAWFAASITPVEPFQAMVTESVVHIRSGPTTAASSVDLTYRRHLVRIVGVTRGEPIDGNDLWYRISPRDGYISAMLVEPFTPPAPPSTWPGRWIDINLSSFYITAYEGTTPIYSAIITAGRDDRTPRGIFYIQRRVRSDTMDSATVGIPKGHREYYYLENVEYVQYFTAKGHAIHGNYWVHPSRYGVFSSNGCAGLMNVDAAWFWGFGQIGTPVHIHF